MNNKKSAAIDRDSQINGQLFLHREIRLLKEELKYIKLSSKDQTPISVQELKEKARLSIIQKLIFPASLLSLWIRTRNPRSLGGASFSKIIEAWKNGGAKETLSLLRRVRLKGH